MWILITVAAAAFQTGRTALQHRLRALLSVGGAGFVRYVYGAPIAIAAVGLIAATGHSLPIPPWRFWPIIAAAGAAQIVATICLIKAFDASDFAIGTVYSKTEVVQTAFFSYVLLGEPLRPLGWLATVTCFGGIALLAGGAQSRPPDAKAASTRFGPAVRFGLAAGGLFGLTAIGIRAASLSLAPNPPLVRALLTLAVMNSMQTVMHGCYLARRQPKQIGLALRHWRSSGVVGVLSVCGSACWALAFTLQNASKVRTLGQVELLFTFGVSHFVFHARHSRRQYAATGLVLASVVAVVAFG